MKKIYFACSIAGGRDHAHVYSDIIGYIKSTGAELMSELFADKELKPEVGMNMDPAEVWKRDVDWIKAADAIVAEVTQPSLGVGYEIGKVEDSNKPVLALFYDGSGRRLSPMIAGNPHVTVVRYNNIKETKSAIIQFLNSLLVLTGGVAQNLAQPQCNIKRDRTG